MLSVAVNKKWFRSGSNRGPSACKADVITTTLRDRLSPVRPSARCPIKIQSVYTHSFQVSSQVRNHVQENSLTPTWIEHATFWSGVRRATIAPQGLKNGWRSCMVVWRDVLFFLSGLHYIDYYSHYVTINGSARARTEDLVRVKHTW